jgi:serine protease AprX
MSATSTSHVKAQLARERQYIEKLRRTHGSEVVDTIDRVTLRGIVAEQRERELEAVLGKDPMSVRFDFPVVATRRSGLTSGDRPMPSATRSERIRSAGIIRERGERLVAPVVESIRNLGGTVTATVWLTHSAVARMGSYALGEVAARNDVTSICHDKFEIISSLDKSRPLIRADLVENNLGITGKGVDVAIMDTGVDGSHAELTLVTQKDFTGEGTGDGFGHGTHCAGVATGHGTQFRGIAPGANLHDYKIMNSAGGSTPSICISGIQQAVTDGMDVLSNSWGFTHLNGAWTDGNGTCVLCVAADAATATSVFAVAGGNDDSASCGTYDTWLGCPAIARNPITIGASDDNDKLADFSSRGPTPDKRAKPDVLAPGVDIVSARASTATDMGGSATVIDPTHVQASGTSMATPHVAGVAALMLQKNRELSNQAVKDILMATAKDLGLDHTTEQGAGRIDALDAVNAS